MSSASNYSGEYLILSLKWSDRSDRLIWWRGNNAGYTSDIDVAGRYSAAEVAAEADYYDNDATTRAVPVAEVMSGAVGPVRRIVDTLFRYHHIRPDVCDPDCD